MARQLSTKIRIIFFLTNILYMVSVSSNALGGREGGREGERGRKEEGGRRKAIKTG